MSERPPSPEATAASRPHGDPATAGARPSGGAGRIAALDGLRGLALLGMLAWHAEVGWVKGGFARMTIFFVLSGYLATASWLSLRDRGTPRPFGTFWRRRARRLLPITLVGVALATAVTAWIGERGQVDDLPGDAGSVIAGVSNWRFLLADRSYGELFERPSAFQHFWSLSLEEQLFWLLPLLVAGAVLVARRRTWIATAVGAVALGVVVPLVVDHSPDAAYYGTHVRAGEFLAGVTLALVLHHHRGEVPARALGPVRVLGSVSLALLVLVMLTVERDHTWLYAGGMFLFAIPATLVVAATRAGRSPATAVLALPPLVWMGRAALSIYALHWPLFQLLDTDRTGLRSPWLPLVQVAVGVGVGLLVYRWAEEPLMARTRSGSTDRRLLPALGAAAAGILVVALLVPLPPAPYDLRELERQLSDGADIDLERSEMVLATRPAPPVPATPAEALAGADEVRIGLFGGSTSVVLGALGDDFAARSPLIDLQPGYARLGCGLLTEGERVHGRTPQGEPAFAPTDDYCLGWDVRWPAVVVEQDLDLAVIMTGVWETADWRLPGRDGVVAIGDPEVDARLLSALTTAIDAVHAQGAGVVLVTTPEIGLGADGQAREKRSIGPDHAERVARYNALLRFVAGARADVALVDYGATIDGLTDAERAELLPDGIHPTEAGARQLWDDSFGPALEQVVRTARTTPS